MNTTKRAAALILCAVMIVSIIPTWVTAAELTQAELALRRASAKGEENMELSVNDLDQVAGGDFWTGDDAPDGHEMGCFITYHQWWTCEENKWWCHNYYYGEHGEIIDR